MKTMTIMTLLALLTAGCVGSRSGKVYTRDQARQVHKLKMGVVTHVEHVLIEGERSGTGAAVGGIAGGVLGSTVSSHNDSQKIGAVVGALAGAAVGAMTEKKVTERQALELTVQLDNGETIVVVQEADEMFAVGERVRVVQGHGATRIRH